MRNVMAAQPNIGGAICESSVIPFLVSRRKVWLTPSAGASCSNAANVGERNTWTQIEFCIGQNSIRGQEPPEMYILCTGPGDGQTSCKDCLASGERCQCSNDAKTRNLLKCARVPQTNEPISAVGGLKFTILWGHVEEILLFVVALCNRGDHYILPCDFYLLFSFPRLISAVGDWMSTILPHMVWR